MKDGLGLEIPASVKDCLGNDVEVGDIVLYLNDKSGLILGRVHSFLSVGKIIKVQDFRYDSAMVFTSLSKITYLYSSDYRNVPFSLLKALYPDGKIPKEGKTSEG